MKNNLSSAPKIPIWIFSLLILTIGCDRFTDVDLPKTQLTASAVFEDRVTANAAMTDVYSKMRDNGLLSGMLTGLSNQMGLYADELVFFGSPGSPSFNFANNSVLPTESTVAELWSSSYSQIYAANAVIEGVEGSTYLAQADKDQLKGEALLVRALVHFYLTETFGNVPYIRTTDYTVNRHAPRTAERDALELAKEDLDEAILLLPENYISPERVRPNKYAAYALLARIDLYLGLWDEAAEAASTVLNQEGLYVWETDLDKIFLKESTTTIWQFMPGLAGDNTKEATTFSFVSLPPPASALSQNLLDAFEAGDQRKVHWVKTIGDGTQNYSHAFKYKEPYNTGSSVEYSIVLRLAEQYLIRAEARAQQGDLIGARQDLNKIRNTAGLPDTGAVTQADILAAVLKERQVELFCEHGHRFFDLKRTQQLDASLGTLKPGWDVTDRVLPIPQSELLLNPNLAPQNEGY